jgi:hypothetical protein
LRLSATHDHPPVLPITGRRGNACARSPIEGCPSRISRGD